MFILACCISANTSDTFSLIEPTVTRERRAMRPSIHHSKHCIQIFYQIESLVADPNGHISGDYSSSSLLSTGVDVRY